MNERMNLTEGEIQLGSNSVTIYEALGTRLSMGGYKSCPGYIQQSITITTTHS